MTVPIPSPQIPLVAAAAPRRAPSRPADARVPSGVGDFDAITGGLPVGSVILLTGEAGAGHQEFALTSATHLMFSYDEVRLHRFYVGTLRENFVYPSGVTYISLTRSRDQVVGEVEISFDATHHDSFVRHLHFHDLSPEYFSDSVVPSNWAQSTSPLLTAADEFESSSAAPNPLEAIVRAVETDGDRNLVILDSLSDLLVRRGIETEDALALVKGLRRRAKEWRGMIYLLLSRGVASASVEQALADSVDGVFSFSWSTHPLRSSRQRTMLIDKFMPVLAHVPHEHQGRFVIRVSSLSGLVTTQYERI